MTVRHRLMLLVTLLITVSVITTASVFAIAAWRTAVEQARQDGVLVARLLAQTVSVAQQAPVTVDDIAGEAMVGQAQLVAQLVGLVRRHAIPADEVQRGLQEVASRSGLGELWVTGADGTPLFSSLDAIDATLGGDDPQLRGRAFEPLRNGSKARLVTGPVHRALDGRTLKIAGVPVPGGGMALVAQDTARLGRTGNRIGLQRLIDTVMAGSPIEAVWVLDGAGAVQAQASTAAGRDAGAIDGDARALAGRVTATAVAEAWLADGLWNALSGASGGLLVAAPVLDQDGLPGGLALLRLPTDRLQSAARALALSAGGLTAVLLIAGIAVTYLVALFIARPIMAVTRAAADMEALRFSPAALDGVARRRDELGRLARVFQSMAREVLAREEHLEGLVRARTHELEMKNQQLERTHKQMEEELLAAQSLQAAILPQHFPKLPTHECDAFMMPARQLGGDFYDLFAIDGEHLAVTIADVSGKGVQAAFFMAISRTILQSTGKEGWPPGECLKRSNDLLCQTNPLTLFVTVFYGILNTRTGEFRYANGGHNPPCLIRSADGDARRVPPTGGIALGVMEDMEFDEATVTLAPGDTVFLFTDGVSEAMDREGNEFTEQRLTETLRRTQSLPVDSLLRRVREQVELFVGGAAQSDDLTCLVLRYAPKQTAEPDPAIEPVIAAD